MLSLNNLTVKVGNKEILKKISFEFAKGKIYAIMGPNGSGKSTLAYTLMGHPAYEVASGSLRLKNEDILSLPPEKRAEKGIFLSFQTPLSLSGVRINQLLQLALAGKKDPLTLRRTVQKYAKALKIKEELLTRSLNDGASGGEKKKMEVLQAAVLDKEIIIFDEVDTGVDIDALKTIAQFLDKTKGQKTYIIITHYQRILKYLKPDKVLVLADGKLRKVGDGKLAKLIEKKGYEDVINS
ncbi:Fe-S cluster assembly ATPase SufC [Candidatus Roizmanbacteria bacterium]|nr:Fe-S cluster assembly ATPase SufC [Candidatus Roizmanbacteria bacterium]